MLDPGSNERLRHADEVLLRIVTTDEHVARLPWVLLADDRKGFLSIAGWSVVVSSQMETSDVELPPSPRMLLVAPEPKGVARTGAGAHGEALENMLSAADSRLSRNQHLWVAETWEAFKTLVSDVEPEVVYYYGHGLGTADTTRLVFASGRERQRIDKPAADFALCLRNLVTPPYLVYVNCCQGDAGGFLGVGKQLEDFVPVVITNRTVARIETAQAQAMALWEDILLEGMAPHRAMAGLYRRMGRLDLSTADARWMTPVLHAHYGAWRANPPPAPDRRLHDPHWHLKIDRVTQFSTVATQTRQMLRECKPRTLAFAWYGREGEGVGIFHQRLNVELREDLSGVHVYEVLPEWPDDLYNPGRSFSDMLIEAFKVNRLEDIPARIRTQTHGATGRQILVYVRHQPVDSPELINPGTLGEYLRWWNSIFVPLLEARQFALLGVSFVVQNPPAFRDFVVEHERLQELYLDRTIFRLLQEMEQIARQDLLDFLRTHSIDLPLDRMDAKLNAILERTGGRYEATIEELKVLIRDRGFSTLEERRTPGKVKYQAGSY